MPIHILPPETVSQIAAGEVVERPASVVKELIENSLDAGADSVTIEIIDAGRSLIRVFDNGTGIPVDELRLAIERHATSKLISVEDLFEIKSLGFRGEALASIGSISRMTITSRASKDKVGGQIKVEGGRDGKVESIGIPTGTEVQVENLFFNVPARLKFLKKDISEKKVIDTLVMRYALAYPHVRFKYSEDGKPILQTTGDGDRRAILAALYGVDIAREMLDVIAGEQYYELSGFISPVAITRSNRKEITFIVNGRWIQDIPLTQALLRAYHTLLMVGRYPIAVLFLDVPPSDIDVNVHPAKAEVRFNNRDWVFGFVQRSVRRALLSFTPVQNGSTAQLWKNVSPATKGSASDGLSMDTSNRSESSHPMTGPGISSPTIQAGIFGKIPLLRLVGQIGAKYLVAEGPDGLYLIDQHAAHERVLFERLMSQFEKKDILSQKLLEPVTVTVSPSAARFIEDQISIMRDLGFEVESFGQNAFQIRALPALFTKINPSDALLALVEDFEEDELPLQNEIEAKVAGRVCKRFAVKTGQILSPEEQRSLLNDLESCVSPRTCPHGRPTMIHLSVDILDKQFGRKGAL